MNFKVFIAGIILIGIGGLMNYLLSSLRSVYFRAYLPPWVYASYGVLVGGAALAVLGFAAKPAPLARMPSSTAAKALENVALFNVLVASCFAGLVLYPGLKFPILITQWPGIYMTVAFFSFVVVGVVGTYAWASMIRSMPGAGRGESVLKQLFLVQLVSGEVGIVGLAFAMFAGGYVGASQSYMGFGSVVVGIDMEFAVIPSAVAIFLVVASSVAGVANVVLSGRFKS